MQREDALRALAALVRRDHAAAAFAVGWLARDVSTEVLSDLVEALQEAQGLLTAPGHYEAYRERWGVVPG